MPDHSAITGSLEGQEKYVCLYVCLKGSRDGAVARALVSHQCVTGSFPGHGVICGLSLLLVLFSSPSTPAFPSPQKPTFPNSNSGL